MRIAIAGCGIAGVSTAIALSGRGHEISVFERAPEPREVGAGIQLSPNAMRHLERWGVGERLSRVAVENQAIEIFDGRSARRLVSIPLGETARARFGAPYLLVHRADLLAALLEEASARSDIRIAFGAPVSGARTDGDLARYSAGGTEETADLLVAADGIRSAVRTTAMHLPGPRLFGRVAWRAGVPIAEIPLGIRPDATGLWFGRGAHMVHYPVSAGNTLNVVLIAEHASEFAGVPGAGLSGPAEELLHLVGETWTLWPLEHIAIPRTWSLGRIVLTGDAAHAMSPSAAQGGAQAIEDAAALAAALDHFPSVPDALAGFAHARRPRVARIAREARINMTIYELKGPAALARDLAISALRPRIHLSRLDWLYSGGDTKFV